MLACRGVRGATIAEANTREAILAATRELLRQLVAANGIEADDIAAAIFTVTPDLDAEFPARAARELGWESVALLCASEIPVSGSLARCIRVLLLWNTDRPTSSIVHCYLNGAEKLRPDRAFSAAFSTCVE